MQPWKLRNAISLSPVRREWEHEGRGESVSGDSVRHDL